MKKLLPVLFVGTVFAVFILSFGIVSAVLTPPAGSIAPAPAVAQTEITVPTISSGQIPDPAPKKQSAILPLAADNAYHEAYNDLYYAMMDSRQSCSLSRYHMTRDSVSALFADVINHSPELFYVDGRLGISYNKTTGIVSSVTFTYTMTGEEIAQASDFYRAEILRILSEMPASGMSNFDKALWIHDYLCMRYAYDSELQYYDAYSFFRDRKGVCQGYTLAYMALLNACGIRTDFAASADMNHIWNLIELDGRWYHVDVTWDDPVHSSGLDIPGRAGHDNFLCSDEAIVKTGHYDWVSHPCDSKRYDGAYLDGIQTALAYLDGSWYCVDRQDGSVRTLTFPTMESKVVFKVEGIWYRWGDHFYYVYSYVNLCEADGKLYYSMPDAIGSYDPYTDTHDLLLTYAEGEGYIYGLYAQGNTLHYLVSKAPGGAEVIEYTHELESEDPGVDPTLPDDPTPGPTEPPDTEPPEGFVDYLNLTCGEDIAAALVSNTVGEEGQSLRVLMIGSVPRLSAYADPIFTVVFHQSGRETYRYQVSGSTLIYYQTLTHGTDRFTAAEGYLLFGITVNKIPPEAWSSATITLRDRRSGQVLFENIVENSLES